MIDNWIFANINTALPHLLRDVLNAPEVLSRAGRTRELRHVGITLTDPLSREILVPGRRTNLAAQIAETAWVLAGRNDIDWLANYLPRARDFSDDGKTWRSGYGPRLRGWHGTDQLAYIVNLLKTDPETRQAVIVLWDPPVDELAGKDRACNNWLHFSSRDGALDLHVAIRSNDLMWGFSGINAFEWSVLLEVVAGLTELTVGSLHFSTTSLHLYERHWDRAAAIVEEAAKTERVTAEPSPRFRADPVLDTMWLDHILKRWFHHEAQIRAGNSYGTDDFPEPMLRSWLHVLDWWWNGNQAAGLIPVQGTALAISAVMGIRPSWDHKIEEKDIKFDEPSVSPFLSYAIKTHNEKHAAYGDSWKRRGEMLGIMANIARKVDRLGGSATADETSADTAMDLMVYLAKYRTWLDEDNPELGSVLSDTPDAANELLVKTERQMAGYFPAPADSNYRSLELALREGFDLLEKQVMSNGPERYKRVDTMLIDAYQLARYLWEAEQQSAREREVRRQENEELDRRVYEEFHPGSTGNPTEYPGADHD